VPRKVRHDLHIVLVDSMDELLALALLPKAAVPPRPKRSRPPRKPGEGDGEPGEQAPRRRIRKPVHRPPAPAPQIA
jgi:hypothetical protein